MSTALAIRPDLDTTLGSLAEDLGEWAFYATVALFLLAHLHTMGRQRDEQHRGFIDHCVQQGWWQIFAKTAPKERSDEWMGVLEQYVDAQVDRSEYEQWMNRFPVIYKLSCWLDDYQEAFLSIDRQKDLETRYNEGRAALPEMKSGERV